LSIWQTSDLSGDGNLEASIDWGSINEDGASDDDECGVDLSRSILRGENIVRGEEGDIVTSLDGSSGAESESWECLDGERSVGGRA
jgi:hypothetical protein